MSAGLAFSYPAMLSQCHVNALNALTNRHLSLAPNKCSAHLANPFLMVFKRLCRGIAFELFPDLENGDWRIGKPTHKLQNIDRSHLYDRVEPNKAKSFCKREVNVAVPTKARLIQGNHNEVTAYQHPAEYGIMNAIMKALRNHEFDWCGVKCKFVYAGGLNHDDLSELFTQEATRSGHVVYDERDGKNWDATMNFQLLNAEAQVYEMLKLRSAAVFLQRCAKVRGVIRTKAHGASVVIKYLTAWKRLSGDWNTSVGNTIISMIIIFTVIKALPPHLRPERWCGLFMGDDYVGILNYVRRPSLIDLKNAMNDLEQACGITPVRALFEDPLRVSFISLGVWPTRSGGFRLVPNPGKQLAKLFWAKDNKFRHNVTAYSHTIAVSFWQTYHGFPLMMRFLKHHHRPGTNLVQLDRYVVEPLTQAVNDVDWRSGFVYRYALPFTATDFDFPKEHAVWHHPVVQHMITIESLDPHERPGAI